MKNYMDLHVHSKCSDGKLNYIQLIEEAKKKGIQYLAITDHNVMPNKKEFKQLQKQYDDMTLIPGSEIDCEYEFKNKRKVTLHLIVLYPCVQKPLKEMYALLKNYKQNNRKAYIQKLIDNLKELNLDVGTYKELKAKYGYIGRPILANELKERGYTKTVNEGMNKYLGDFGERLALNNLPKKNKQSLYTLDEVIDVVHKTYGICILAHLYYYKLNEDEEIELLEYFSKKVGKSGGLEVKYRAYNEKQRNKLKEYSDKYDLFPSVASDYHGYYETDSLENCFEGDSLYQDLVYRWLDYYLGKKHV